MQVNYSRSSLVIIQSSVTCYSQIFAGIFCRGRFSLCLGKVYTIHFKLLLGAANIKLCNFVLVSFKGQVSRDHAPGRHITKSTVDIFGGSII